MPGKTAGIIIVGDEILKGHVKDTNSHFMCRRFLAVGTKVVKMSVVGDEINDIANSVKEFSQSFDIVVTSGGIGPTHDDVTYKGIAAGFNEEVIPNDKLSTYWNIITDVESSRAMSLIPKSAQIIWLNLESEKCKDKEKEVLYEQVLRCEQNTFPIVRVHNVFVLPGIPQYLQAVFFALEKDYFHSHGCSFFTGRIYLSVHEDVIVKALNQSVVKFKDCVFGSYPAIANTNYKTQITVEGVTAGQVKAAEDFFTSLLPADWLSSCYIKMPNPVYQFLKSTSDPQLAEKLNKSIMLVEQSFTNYPPEGLMVSFNGGKDCTVLLHIVLAVKDNKGISQPLQAVYFKPNNPFPEVEQFIQESVDRYQIELTTLPGSIKPALEVLVKQKEAVKAIFLGTRRTDPFSESLKDQQVTDPGWTQLMRINPILDWSYQDIWAFLRGVSVQYCPLYNQGYTSLGNRDNTKPNPCLQYTEPDGTVKYHPAWMLTDDSVERNGRL